jgi:pyrimidine-specific ribonucleoside hydrolase
VEAEAAETLVCVAPKTWFACYFEVGATAPTAQEQDYVGIIGDAGALVSLTHPELFTTAHAPTRINLPGIGRGQTIVDRRRSRRIRTPTAGTGRRRPRFVLHLETAQAAQAFTDVVDTYAAYRC